MTAEPTTEPTRAATTAAEPGPAEDSGPTAGGARGVADGHVRQTRLRDRMVVLLTVVSGATDAIGYLALGSAFTSVMTGNMVLVGVAVGTGDGSALGLVLTAIAGYIVGVAVGGRVAGNPSGGDPVWPAAVTRALLLESVLLAVYAIGWWVYAGEPPTSWFGPLLALNAMALGVQSSAIKRFGVSGLSTTYMTGTLTTVVMRVVHRQPLHTVRLSVSILAGLIVGAGAGALLVTQVPIAAPILQLGLLAVVLASTWMQRRLRD